MDLTARIDRCRTLWSLRVGDRLSGGFRADVFAATGTDGAELVLKLLASPEEYRREASALEVWAGTGAALEPVAGDPVSAALLSRRLRPGTPLPRCAPLAAGDPHDEGRTVDPSAGAYDPEPVAVVAGLLGRLHGCGVPDGRRFPTPAAVLPRLERVALADLSHERRTHREPGRAAVGLRRLPDARRLLHGLAADDVTPVLLHGDPLVKNVLADAGGPFGWRLIDPMPQVGDPCADVGMVAHDQSAGCALDVAADLGRRLGLSVDRCVAWTVGWTVHLVLQAWREDQPRLEAALDTPAYARVLD
ncbi:streptomycin 6-kinase [Friedmanniella endophytica]|uniref:Streptomycin 6-kinase n=1 Tax=Microlunatus kandeliicorticis TaxID=1759536 RepID=A0A7W3P502_9ACTN|nr:phosphotransferase [Microlunatus kandeliicorticis]MBA8793380.1 streptomycin 6-kinase [Microlunatus kandeliicorticis]